MKKLAMLALLGVGLVGCGSAAPPAPSNTPAALPGETAAPATPEAPATPPAEPAAPAATPEAK